MTFRRLMPKTFFARGLLIVMLPVLLIEAVSAYIFYGRHWENVTRHMTNSLAGEVALLAYLEQSLTRPEREELEWAFGWTTGITPRFYAQATLPDIAISAYPDLTSLLKRRTGLPVAIEAVEAENAMKIHLQLPDGVLTLDVSAKRVESRTTTIFILWAAGCTVIFLSIAVLFLRNQVRPIRQLAEAAERFGKGDSIIDLKPHGAQEIRRAARAFLVMRERILRQIRSRTEMLAGISHDLRTPLTRIKLQLAMLGDTQEARDMAADVKQMEHMIAEYLDFARGDAGEDVQTIDAAAMLKDIARDYQRGGHMIHVSCPEDIRLQVRPQAVRRMLGNLIDNSLRYGTACTIQVRRSKSKVEWVIDDNGPGIPQTQREEVFRPFLRLDASRNLTTGGVGLGLTIARDIARSHGGNILLSDSPEGGLRAIVRLPL